MIVLVLCALGSLTAAPRLTASAPQAPVAPPSSRAPSRPWSATGEICVRLERFETQDTLSVQGARNSRAALEITRSGATLRASDGAEGATEVWVEPRDSSTGLALGDARYPGRLRV
ncbi:MAG TPA: hypothetical protein VM509_12150, partial [Planctomycetota bacterium]|nr:hypothetical protein [Planctomycetota bacterium]